MHNICIQSFISNTIMARKNESDWIIRLNAILIMIIYCFSQIANRNMILLFKYSRKNCFWIIYVFQRSVLCIHLLLVNSCINDDVVKCTECIIQNFTNPMDTNILKENFVLLCLSVEQEMSPVSLSSSSKM